MSDLENSFKNALTDFDEVHVSSSLWLRISSTLLLKSIGFKIAAISLTAILVIGLPAYFFFIPSNQNNVSESSNDTREFNYKNDKNSHQISNDNKEIKSQTTASNAASDKTDDRQMRTITNARLSEHKPAKQNKNHSNAIIVAKEPEQPQTTIKTKSALNNTSAQAKKVISTSIITIEENNDEQNSIIKLEKPLSGISKITNESETELEMYPSIEGFYDFNNKAAFNNENINLKKPLPHFYNNGNRYTTKLEIFAGPNIAFSQMKLADASYKNLLELRKQNESPKLSYHIGLNYKRYYNNWFMSLGINYHRIEDKAYYDVVEFDVDSVISSYMIFKTNYKRTIVGYINNPNDSNSLLPVYKVTSKQDTTLVHNVYYDSTNITKSVSFTNTYSYIDIPLIFGREFNYRQFVFDVSGGVSWGRLIKTAANIPKENTQEFYTEKELDNLLIKNSFNALFGLGFGYRINEGNTLFIRPELRYNLNSMLDKSYPINQKYLQLRLTVGIRIYF